MTERDKEKAKLDLLQALEETKSIAPELIQKGRNLAEAGQLALDSGKCLEVLAKSSVADSFTAPAFDHLAAGYREFNLVATQQSRKITEHRALLLLSTANVTAMTVTSTAVFSISPISVPAELRPLFALLHEGVDVGAVKESMKVLGLDAASASSRTPLQLLQSAEDALKRPSSDEGYATAVLIPLRESIQATIDALLKKRLFVERARSWSQKIASIAQRSGDVAMSPEHVERVGETTRSLIDQLSGGKNRNMTREEIAVLFDEGISLLRDILSLVHATKSRASLTR